MVAGFTGTQTGMTQEQFDTVWELLLALCPTKGRHGDCIGADADFHELCIAAHIPVVIHPPEKDAKRAFCKGAFSVLPVKPYLVRNRAIVDRSDYMIATPKDYEKPASLRGQGTWSTIAYAERVGTDVYIIPPDGVRL